jgi:hypothetical protein
MSIAARLCAIACASTLGLAGLAAPQALAAEDSAAATVRVHLVAIDRNGHSAAVSATIYTTQDPPIFADTPRVSVPRGAAWIAADVSTSGPENTIENTTLVVRHVDITRSETIDLDARGGKLVKFSLNVPGATDTSDSAQVCVGGDFVSGPGMQASSNAGTLYVVPARSSALIFGYASSWQNGSDSYFIDGQSGGGVPSRPHYSARVADLARVQFTFRSGEVVGGYRDAGIENNASCGLSTGLSTPSSTDYLSAGSWTASADGNRSFWQSTRRFKAGRAYAVTFGGAVWGPYENFPSVQGRQIVIFPMAPISDPATQNSDECCDISTISLSSGGHVLKHSVLSEYREIRDFQVTLPRAGWYTMRTSARRWIPGVSVPADILTPRESLTWTFRAAPQAIGASNLLLVPVTAMLFAPQGLNLDNQAAPGASTVLSMDVVEPRAAGFVSPPRYAVRSVTVEVSFNDGRTWQRISAHGHGTSWQATVHDPLSGFVSLRSTVVDSAHDSSTETIYQAYAIAS